MRVALYGMGRLGASLAILLRDHVEVVCWRRGEEPPSADVAWVVVRDEAIAEVAALVPRGGVCLHASGALGPEVLGDHPERGVLHPLMTFPGPAVGVPDVRGAGAGIDGTPGAVAVATSLARLLGFEPFPIPPDRRLYHAAACLSAGHLAAAFQEAVDVLVRAGVSPEAAPRLLYPLSAESLRRVAQVGPLAITGPAARGDRATIDAHRAALPEASRRVYDALGEAIARHRGQRR